jgi:hypothetical protein
MKKYSIIINHIWNDLYAVVLKSWSIDENGIETNIETSVKTDLTFEQAIGEQTKFLK